MRNSQQSPSYQQASPMAAPVPTTPPSYNAPVDWSQRAMPASAGGVNTTGPGQYAPSGAGSSLPSLPDKGLTISGSNIGNQFKSGIRNALDPAGGQLNPFKATGNIVRNTLDPAGIFGSNDPKKVKGTIDPVAGTYTATNYGKNNAAISAAATEFLRTGNVPSSLKHSRGMYTKVKKAIREQQAHGGPDGGAWEWGTPSAGAPTVIPGQGPVNWGQQPGTGAPPPAAGAPPPAQGGWVKPAPLPSPPPYNPQAAVATALRKPTGGGSKLVGGYQGP